MPDMLHPNCGPLCATGDTPLALACGSGAVPAMDVLLAHGADPSSDKRSDGIRPLHRAATAPAPDAITRLATAGADMDPVSSMGTPLCLAAHMRRPQNISALLKWVHSAEGAQQCGTGAAADPPPSPPRLLNQRRRCCRRRHCCAAASTAASAVWGSCAAVGFIHIRKCGSPHHLPGGTAGMAPTPTVAAWRARPASCWR